MTTTLGDFSICSPNLNQLTSGTLLKLGFRKSNYYSELRILPTGVTGGGPGNSSALSPESCLEHLPLMWLKALVADGVSSPHSTSTDHQGQAKTELCDWQYYIFAPVASLTLQI